MLFHIILGWVTLITLTLSVRVIREMFDKWIWLYVPAAQMLIFFSADTYRKLNTLVWDSTKVKCAKFNIIKFNIKAERCCEIIRNVKRKIL